MLANVLIESFVLKDIKLGDQERNRQVNNLTNINRYTVFSLNKWVNGIPIQIRSGLLNPL
jgi:hypothetical protein